MSKTLSQLNRVVSIEEWTENFWAFQITVSDAKAQYIIEAVDMAEACRIAREVHTARENWLGHNVDVEAVEAIGAIKLEHIRCVSAPHLFDVDEDELMGLKPPLAVEVVQPHEDFFIHIVNQDDGIFVRWKYGAIRASDKAQATAISQLIALVYKTGIDHRPTVTTYPDYERDRFEKWIVFTSQFGPKDLDRLPGASGLYDNVKIQKLWEVWDAATKPLPPEAG